MESIFESYEKAVNHQLEFMHDGELMLGKLIDGLKRETANSNDVKSQVTCIGNSSKEYQSLLSKLSKAVDKKFKSDLDEMWDPKVVSGKETVVYRILLRHFIREGHFDLANTFSQESGSPMETALNEQFVAMFEISKALRVGSVDLAIKWAKDHSEALAKSGSNFEFKLHEFKYLQLMKSMDTKSAILYAKTNFASFKGKHLKGLEWLTLEIQQLLCSLLFARRLDKSPYPQFADLYLASYLEVQFSREFSQLLGQSFDSPLFTAVTVGSIALPMIMKLSVLMKDKSLEWSQANELPVSLPLLDSQRYHSVFVCPVTKEHGTDTNPPMMMLCGHVLSKESLTRLSKGSMTSRFKCPYCPSDSTASQAVQIYF